jgi:PTH1 family peptidyl-tRNA hydrolase
LYLGVKIVVGLGNPGPKYDKTRHNYGFMVIDELLRRYRVQPTAGSFSALIAQVASSGDKVLLVKPMTFMNASGSAVGPLARYYKVEPENILVVVDDLDLPLGHMRMRPKGSSGGHNGLKSIIAALGTEDFPRLRLGIGSPGDRNEVINYVLAPFPKVDVPIVQQVVVRAADAVEEWLVHGVDHVMSRFNKAVEMPK